MYRNRRVASFSRLSRVLWMLNLRKNEIYELKFHDVICIMEPASDKVRRIDRTFDFRLYNPQTRARSRSTKIDTVSHDWQYSHVCRLVGFIMRVLDLFFWLFWCSVFPKLALVWRVFFLCLYYFLDFYDLWEFTARLTSDGWIIE